MSKENENAPLTERENEVLSLTNQGYQQKEIARLLKIELNTVKAHTRNARRKTGETSTRLAARNHLKLLTESYPHFSIDLLPKGVELSGGISHDDKGSSSFSPGDGPSDAVGASPPLQPKADQKEPSPDSKRFSETSYWQQLTLELKSLSPLRWLGLIPLTSMLLGLAGATLLFLTTSMLENLNKLVR